MEIKKKNSTRKWAIAIVIIIVVIALALPGSSTTSNPICSPYISGFSCKIINYSTSTGHINFKIGINNGNNWSSVQMVPVLASAYSQNPTSSSYWNSTNVVQVGKLQNGQTVNITLKISNITFSNLQTQQYIILASYQINSNASVEYSAVAIFRLK